MADRFNIMAEDSRYCFAAALFFYRRGSAFREITRGLKYRGEFSQGRLFGRMLGRKLLSSPGHIFEDVNLIVPVPLHWTRKLLRGYNQAAVIAKALAGELGAPIDCNLLSRRRRTKSQTMLDSEGKRKNVENAFVVRRRAKLRQRGRGTALSGGRSTNKKAGIPGHIVLVDDVFTTGATLAACHKALRKVFGAETRISVVTLGYAG